MRTNTKCTFLPLITLVALFKFEPSFAGSTGVPTGAAVAMSALPAAMILMMNKNKGQIAGPGPKGAATAAAPGGQPTKDSAQPCEPELHAIDPGFDCGSALNKRLNDTVAGKAALKAQTDVVVVSSMQENSATADPQTGQSGIMNVAGNTSDFAKQGQDLKAQEDIKYQSYFLDISKQADTHASFYNLAAMPSTYTGSNCVNIPVPSGPSTQCKITVTDPFAQNAVKQFTQTGVVSISSLPQTVSVITGAVQKLQARVRSISTNATAAEVAAFNDAGSDTTAATNSLKAQTGLINEASQLGAGSGTNAVGGGTDDSAAINAKNAEINAQNAAINAQNAAANTQSSTVNYLNGEANTLNAETNTQNAAANVLSTSCPGNPACAWKEGSLVPGSPSCCFTP